MQASTQDTVCSCGSIGRTDLRQCQVDHHIWKGDRRLTSVGRIVAGSFPLDSKIPAEILENARERGSETDALFGAYVLGKLDAIPAGTRRDSEVLFYKLQKWYDVQRFKRVEVQVLLGGEDHGGVVDFIFDDVTLDLKCTYNVEVTHMLQVAGYAALRGHNGGHILHVTERLKEPRLVNVLEPELNDWRIMLEHWRMCERRRKP